MRRERLVRLALGEVGSPLWKSWSLALGVALGVATLVMLFGLSAGVENALRVRLVGSLPDRMRVEPSPFQMGPVRLGDSLGEDTVDRLRALPGVRQVYRQARLPVPVQLHASYGGQDFWSDVILEGVDPGLVEPQLARGQSFEAAGRPEVPAVLPRVMMDVLAAGVSIHTNLPTISPDLLAGRHFTLVVGRSSFGASQNRLQRHRCVIAGISDQVGLGGPSVPLEALQTWTPGPLRYYAVTLALDSAARAPEVEEHLRRMGLQAPGMAMARQLGTTLAWVRSALIVFGSALLLVAGMSIFSGLSLQVREEQTTLGLYRALGASRRDILGLYLARAGLLGTAGSLLGLMSGLLIGAWSGRGIASLAPGGEGSATTLFHPDLSITLGFVAFGIGTSLVAGFLPARRAARLSPAEVLRR